MTTYVAGFQCAIFTFIMHRPTSNCSCVSYIKSVILADRTDGRAIGTAFNVASSVVVCNVKYCG